jgi:D-serine deaminase-like pyridoxal phosphate-dependent protein
MPVKEAKTSLALGTVLYGLPHHACTAAWPLGQYHVVGGSREGTAVWSRTRAGWL